MMKTKILVFGGCASLAIVFFLAGCSSVNTASNLFSKTGQALGQTASPAGAGETSGSSQPMTYKNTGRNFAFTIPAGWSKQSGDVNSEQVLFMMLPKTCSFQFHITRMQPSFPAESSVRASLKSATEDITIDKLLSAKRRDETGRENGKRVQFTRGWQVMEKGKPGSHQRIIYQAYDRENYYFNFMGASETEQFGECRPMLEEIVASIKFGD